MPFTPPSTVASQANAGYYARILIGSPPGAIAEIKTFTADAISMPEVDNTHLLSPNNTREFVPGMIKPGKIQFSGNFIGDASQLQIETLAEAQTIFFYQIEAPVQRGTKTYTGTGMGFISAYKLGPFENDKAIEYQAEIQMTGPFSQGVA